MSNQVTAETKQVSTVLDKSIKAVAATVAASNKTFTEVQAGLETLLNKQVSLSQDIEYKGRELAEISVQTEQKLRDAKIELDFKVRENEDKVRGELLSKAGLVATTQAELNRLNSELSAAKDAAQRTEFDAVSAAEQKLHSEYKALLATQKAQNDVVLAEFKANAKSDTARIQSLNEQVEQLREDLAAERKARVDIAQAEANKQGVVVNTGK